MKKRLFTLLLAVVMVLSLFPALSQTAEAYGVYDLWVGGVQVDTANQNDILGDGTAWFDSSTNTLWLDNANITTAYTFDTGENRTAFVYSDGIDLTIRGSAAITGAANYGIYVPNGTLTVNADLNITVTSAGNGYATVAMSCYKDISILGGTMNLTAASSAIYSPSGNVTISGGSLTLKGGGIYAAIEAKGAVTITDDVEYVDATASYGAIRSATNSISIGTGLAVTEPENPVYGNFVYQSDGTTKAKHVVITHVQAYDLWVGGVQVTGLNKDDILGDGTVSFDPSTTTLTLDNPTLNGSHGDKYNRDAAIYSELTADLTLEGRGTIGNSKYTFGVYAQSDAEGNGGGLILNGDFNIIEGNYDSVLARGDLTVLGGHLVTGSIYGGENSNIYLLGGSVVVSGNITAGYDINIGPGIEHLEAVYSGSGSSALLAKGSINIDPSLEIVIPKNPLIKRDGNYTYMYSVSSTGGYSKATRVVITRAYDLWVGGVRVTGANKDDILGDGGKAKYNPDTQELTLNNLTLTGAYPAEGSNAVIYSKMADVILKGKATINAAGHTWGVYAGATSGGYDGELVINGDFTVTGASGYDLLSYGDLTVQGGNLTCGSLRGYNHDVRINGGTVTATNGIMADGNIYISNGVKKVDASGKIFAIYAYGRTISLGDELIITEPEPANVKDGYVYEPDGETVAEHVVIVNPKFLPPEIFQQPTSIEVVESNYANFFVFAMGTDLTFQWQYKTPTGDWKDCSSATQGYNTPTLSVQGVTGSANRDGYQYRCVVTSPGGSVTSDAATLHVLAIKTQPKNATVNDSEYAAFKVVATGTGLTYQWQYKNPATGVWKNSSSATDGYNTATLNVVATAARNGYQYRCIVTDANGNKVTSKAATLTVKSGPTITTQPKNATAVSTGTASFQVVASGTGLTYQWQYLKPGGEWKNCSSATTGYNKATLKVAGVSGSTNRDGYAYRCIVKDSGGKSVTSNVVILRVFAIKTQPVSVSTVSGTTATFKVAATGNIAKYQWQYKTPSSSWVNCTSATTGYNKATLQVAAEAKRDGYQYRCIVTDGSGNTLTSSAATLSLTNSLKITTQPKAASVVGTETATFKVVAEGTGLTYQWQYKRPDREWKDCSSATTGYNKATLKVAGVSGSTNRDLYQYRCIVKDTNGNSVTSNPATLRVFAITEQPGPTKTVSQGNVAVISVVVSGTDITFQWQYKNPATGVWKDCSSATTGYNTATIFVQGTAARNGYQYRCLVTCGSTTLTSDTTTLTVK